MKSTNSFQSAHSRHRRRRWTAILCCVLGISFALSPVFHGMFHAVGVTHRHPSGSAHQHVDAAADTRVVVASHDHHHDAHHGHRHHRASTKSGSRQTVNQGQQHFHSGESRGNPQQQHLAAADLDKTPNESSSKSESPMPGDSDDDLPIFVLLEIDTTDVVSVLVTVPTVTPSYDDVAIASARFSRAILLGLAGPRGPPA
ncbi:MAG: hypothetical protein AAFP90_06310 [Planctomycetota bacterium]